MRRIYKDTLLSKIYWWSASNSHLDLNLEAGTATLCRDLTAGALDPFRLCGLMEINNDHFGKRNAYAVHEVKGIFLGQCHEQEGECSRKVAPAAAPSEYRGHMQVACMLAAAGNATPRMMFPRNSLATPSLSGGITGMHPQSLAAVVALSRSL